MKKGLFTILICVFSLPIFAQESFILHSVKSGESISSICKDYGISKKELNQLNPSVSNYVYVGQELKIPASAKKLEAKSDTDKKKNKITLFKSKKSEKPTAETRYDAPNESAPERSESVPVRQEAPSTSNNVSDEASNGNLREEPVPITVAPEKPAVVNKAETVQTDSKIESAGYERIGYMLAPEGVKNFWGFSFAMGLGTRNSSTDVLFWESFINLYYEYSTLGSSMEVMGTKIKTDVSTGNFGAAIPLNLGLNLGDIISLRAGGFVQLSIFGHSTTETEIREGKETNKDSKTVRFKDMDDLNRVRYGVSFDVSFGGKVSDWGIGYTMTYQKDVKDPVNMISVVAYF